MSCYGCKCNLCVRSCELYSGSSVPGLKESVHVPLVLPVPTIRPTASARVAVITGLWESTETRLEIPTPIIRGVAVARTGAAAGLYEAFTTYVVLPDAEPPRGEADVQLAVSSVWQEIYTTEAIPLTSKAPTASASAQARGAVIASQETAQTIINL